MHDAGPADTMRLSLRVVQWPSEHVAGRDVEAPALQRAYRMWAHAQSRLAAGDEFARVDALSTLKRAVNQRLRLLNHAYRFRTMPLKDMPKHVLEQLAYLGIVRPLMLRKLFELRNAIEHDDEPPPSAGASEELLEFVWYFLRSTDPIVRSVPTDLLFKPDLGGMSPYWFSVATGPVHDWTFDVTAGVPISFIEDSDEEALLIVTKYRTTFGVRQEGWDSQERDFMRTEEDPPQDEEDVIFGGAIVGPPSGLRLLCARYFFPQPAFGQ
jgi:hypothetical protein